jgi:flagellar basal-body rod modification protein FlgD
MTSVNPLQPIIGGPSSGSTEAGGALGKDDFLKLLVGQLQHQNPLDPMKDQDFMGQMAQFSLLEQVANLGASSERSSAVALLGKTVSYRDADGNDAEGVVETVETKGKTVSLTIGGNAGIKLEAVTEVR